MPPEKAITPPRLIMVSNRLPVTVADDGTSTLAFKYSGGGLAAGPSAYQEMVRREAEAVAREKGTEPVHREVLWVGWPGQAVDDPAEREAVSQRLRTEHGAHPVFLDA